MLVIRDYYKMRLVFISLAFDFAIELTIILPDLTFKGLIGPQRNLFMNYTLDSIIYLGLYAVMNCWTI